MMFYLQDKLTQEKIQSEIKRFVFEATRIEVGRPTMYLRSFKMDEGWKDFYEEEKEERRDLKEFMSWHGNHREEIHLVITKSSQVSSSPKIEVSFIGKPNEETFEKLINLGWKINGSQMVYSFQQEEVYEKDNVSLFFYNTICLYADYEWIIINDNLRTDD